MCKIYVAYGINELNRSGHEKLYKNMAVIMSEEKNHQDGMGYAAIDEKGNLFGERWLINNEAFNIRDVFTKKNSETISKFNNLLVKPEKYNSFGIINLNGITAITLHARLATSSKDFSNTHPFVEKDTSLIHNGTITNFKDSKFREGNSDCDSEVILTEYNDLKLNNNIKNINKLTRKIKGKYACAIFSKLTEGHRNNRHLDIIKSKTASLIAGYIKELDSMVFTSRVEHLKAACEASNLTLETYYNVKDSSLIRLSPFNGEVINAITFDETNEYSDENIKKDLQNTKKKKYTLNDDYMTINDLTKRDLV